MIKTLPQLAVELNKIAPTRYSHFDINDTSPPPFICYLDEGEDNFHADDDVLVEGINISIELYTITKDLTKEHEIKNMLKKNKVPYEKGPTIRIESEGLFLTTFTVELIN